MLPGEVNDYLPKRRREVVGFINDQGVEGRDGKGAHPALGSFL
jgi:hypothetical protein